MMVDNFDLLLRAREKELSAIYKNVPGIVFYIAVEPDGEFRFLSVSSDFLVATGLTRQQIVGTLVRDVIPPPSRDMVLNHYREAILSGQTVRWEEESVYPAGRKYGEVAVTALYDAGGVATHLIGIVHDITGRKRFEEAHRENAERQAFLLRLSDALRSAVDPGAMQTVCRMLGEHLRVNRVSYADIEGDELIIRESWAKDVSPCGRRAPVTAFGKARIEAFRRGETISSDDVVGDPRFTGLEQENFRAVEMRAFVSIGLTKSGQWLGTFVVHSRTPRVWTNAEIGLVQEVAERSWSAAERARAEEMLREREQRLRLALDASGAGSWMRDARTGRVDWDHRFRELYGFTAEEPASFESWLNRVHEEDRRQVLELLQQILDTKSQDTFDATFRIVRPDGTVLWIQSLGQAHRDADGQIMRFTGLELDATGRRRAEEALQARRDEEALQRSHAELERRTLQLSRLASQLTLAEQHAREQLAKTLHDGLQQLLFSAAMTLDRAVKATSEADNVGLLQKVRANINEAMVAARTLSVDLFPPVLHIGGLPAALAWLARRTQEQYRIVVSVTVDARANPEARDVRILLFEAVRELLFNAVKHAHADRVDINLTLEPDDIIHIEVKDEGVGFDPAVTFHHRNRQQVGLGLFSIQERLALLGGRLDIQSALGKGARFNLTLPRTDLPRRTTDTTEAPRRGSRRRGDRRVYASTAGAPKPVRILIADDHVVARAGLRELFSDRPGLQVVGEAANGVEAMSQAGALQPDIIVMDVSMPQMNGIEATRQIHGALPHIRIVGLSTHNDEGIERAMREAGADAYFTKNEGADRLLDHLLSLSAQAKGAV